ncbi:MAG: LysR family transcriptional regulator [Betaproteobacteria bacterium]|nr:LysR family transcriptional regulator [Betaproteobacteria bacterium]
MTLRVLGRRGPAIGPGKAELVERIAQTGSISAAARAMGMSYRRAWQLVEALNRDFGEAVVATAIGGRAGGGARVSGFGRRIVARYRAMEAKACRSIAAEVKAFEALLARRKR